jgi:hypothetical protein
MENLIANLLEEIKWNQEQAENCISEKLTLHYFARIEGLQTALTMAELALDNNLKEAGN